MRFFSFCLLVLAFTLLSCNRLHPQTVAAPRPVLALRFHGDTDFGAGERQAIEQAAANLAHDTGGRYVVTFVWDLDFHDMVSIDRARRDGWSLVRKDSDPFSDPAIGHIVGLTSVEGKVMVLFYDRLETEREWTHVAMHELLHAAGLLHVCTLEMVGYPGCGMYETDELAVASMMFPMYADNPPLHMQRGDYQEFCRVFKCSVNDVMPKP
jgi:hypothetical protein